MHAKLSGLTANPFQNAPGSTYFYSSINHERFLGRLVDGFRDRLGLHLILGEQGTGKTTLCRYLQTVFAHEFIMGYLGDPFVTDREFLAHICAELGVAVDDADTPKALQDRLTAWLRGKAAAGQNVIFFIDEAHLLASNLWDRVLVLSNLQHDGAPLIQLVLAGVDELLETLAKPRFASLSQRIGNRCHLRALTLEETLQYVRHRLKKAGASGSMGASIFDERIVRMIWKASRGIPRLINHACRLCLERAAQQGLERVTPGVVREVLAEPAYGQMFKQPGRNVPVLVPALAAGVAVLLAGGLWMWQAGLLPWHAGDSWQQTMAGIMDAALGEENFQVRARAERQVASVESGQPSPVSEVGSSGREADAAEGAAGASDAVAETPLEFLPEVMASGDEDGPGGIGERTMGTGSGEIVVRVVIDHEDRARGGGSGYAAQGAEGASAEAVALALGERLTHVLPDAVGGAPETSGLRRIAPEESSDESLPGAGSLAMEENPRREPVRPGPVRVAKRSPTSRPQPGQNTGSVAGPASASASQEDFEPLPPRWERVQISAIAYNMDPRKRMVVIEGRILRLGDRFDTARVEGIGMDHIILSEKGRRYRIALPER